MAAELVVDASLHDAEDLLALGMRLVLRPPRPAERLLDGLLGAVAVAGVGQALVEDHRDVRPDHALHGHRFLRTEEELVPVEMRVEAAAVFRELAHLRERKDLEAAGIGENRPVPSHELVKPARGGDYVGTWPQQKVVGVAENDLRLQLLQVARLKRLDRSESPHVHEDRCLHRAVRGGQQPQSRLRARVFF